MKKNDAEDKIRSHWKNSGKMEVLKGAEEKVRIGESC